MALQKYEVFDGSNINQQLSEVIKSANKKQFPSKSLLILSSIQLVCGILLFIFHFITNAVASEYLYIYRDIVLASYSGVWGGIFVSITGIIGILSAKKRDQNLTIALLVLTIFSSLIGAAVIIISSITTAFYLPGFILHIIIVILSCLQFVVAIVTGGYSCYGLCGCCQPKVIPIVYQVSSNGNDGVMFHAVNIPQLF